MQGAGSSRAVPADLIAETVRSIVSRMSGRSAISDTDDLSADLGFDDSDRIELLMAAELALGIVFPEEGAEDIDTVNDLIALAIKVSPVMQMAEDRQTNKVGTEALRDAIQELAVGAAKAGRIIDLSAAPEVLKLHHPTADLPLEEINAELRVHAKRTGAKTSMGRWRD